jgi:uncharacterized membrane protein
MAATYDSSADRNFSAGRLLGRVFATIAHNPIPTIGLAFLIGAIPGALTTYILQLARPEIIAEKGLGLGFYGLTLSSWILGMIVGALTQAALTRSTVAEAEGRRTTIGECLSAGLAVLLPLIILSILLALGVALGFMLLIVPGIILYCMWSVAVPALVEERLGVFGSFARSKDLTDGAKWKVFGVLLILLLFYWLLSAIAGIFMFDGVDFSNPDAAFQMSTGFIVMNLVVGTVVNLFWSLVQASLYVELRQWKDGPATASLERIFA